LSGKGSLEVKRLRVIVSDNLVRVRRDQERRARTGVPKASKSAVPNECATGAVVVGENQSTLSEKRVELDLSTAGVPVGVLEHDDRLRRGYPAVVLEGYLLIRVRRRIRTLLECGLARGAEIAVGGNTEYDFVQQICRREISCSSTL